MSTELFELLTYATSGIGIFPSLTVSDVQLVDHHERLASAENPT